MSIEKNIERCADALEELVRKFEHIGVAVSSEGMPPEVKPSETVTQEPPAPPAPSGNTTPEPPAPPAQPEPPAPPVASESAMTAESLNEAMVEECSRLGAKGYEMILELMESKFGVKQIPALKPEDYKPLLDAVKALQP